MWMNTQIVALDYQPQTFYTPWFPKGADNAVFTLEKILDTISGTDFAVSVLTKNREDEGSAGSAVATFSALSGGFWEAIVPANWAAPVRLLEMVRFKITFKADAAGEGLIYRFLPPTWFDTAV